MSEEKVLKIVGDYKITEKDVDEYITRLPAEQQAYANQPMVRAQVLEQVIAAHLLTLKGKEDKIEETEMFRVAMDKARDEIIGQLALQEALKDVDMTDDEVYKYFKENEREFEEKTTVSARHILTKTEEECKAIADRINAGEISFQDAAKECSTCPSSAKGGDLGSFGHGQMVKEFDEAAFAAELNTLVGPVKTQFGYHLIQVYDKKVSPAKTFEEVKDLLKANLVIHKKNTAYSDLIAELRSKYVKE